MKIRTKIEGLKLLQASNLNYFPEEIFSKGDVSSILRFINEYPRYRFYIRDMVNPQGMWYYGLGEEVFEWINTYPEKFSIAVAASNYGSPKLVGDIFLSKDLTSFIFALSDNPKDTPRTARDFPKWYVNSSYFEYEKDIYKVPYLGCIVDYLFTNSLFDVIVECAAYDKDVGIRNENVAIFELRTYY